MQLHRSLISLIIAIIVLILISQSVSVVNQGQTGVRMNGGSATATGLAPGLHFRVPFFGRIIGLDDHWITLDSSQQNGGRVKLVSSDGKALEAGYAAVWRITDAEAFCQATGCDQSAGAQRINDALTPLLQQVFAAHSAADLLSGKGNNLLDGIPAKLNSTLRTLGVAVQEMHLTALTLPPDQRTEVYERMRAAQSDEAAQVHAKGVASADEIRAQADQQRAEILAKADIQAQTIRGQAQAEATSIYARAYQQDPEFFQFYRSLQAYKRTIRKDNSVIVLGTDSPFLKYLNGLKVPPGPAP